MNIFYKLKNFFTRGKIRQIPEPKPIKKDKMCMDYLKIEEDPFSKLLKDENIQRINIDKELIPIFKDSIRKIRDYFIKNDFMSVKNYDEFFEKYLLDGKLTIRLSNKDEFNNKGTGGEYKKQQNEIVIDTKSINVGALCHEFIHFLVMADSKKLDWSPSQISFINEGFTELLTSEINNSYPQCYFKNVSMVRFLNLLTKNLSIKAFLRDEFTIEDIYMWSSINSLSSNLDIESYRIIQRTFIEKLIDKNNIKTIEDYIQVINLLKQRPSFDKEYMEAFLADLNTEFLKNMGLPVNEETLKLLNQYCDTSYKAEEFGNREVIEFSLNGINGSFDEDGKVYGDFPDGGVTSQATVFIELRHNGKNKRYSLNNFKGINWVEEFNRAKEALYLLCSYKEKEDIIR